MMLKVTEPPATLHYDRWLGPAPDAPYCEARVRVNWRWNLDYGGGQLLDWIGHHVDIAHCGMGWDANGPVDVEGTGEYPPRTDLFNAAKTLHGALQVSGRDGDDHCGRLPRVQERHEADRRKGLGVGGPRQD